MADDRLPWDKKEPEPTWLDDVLTNTGAFALGGLHGATLGFSDEIVDETAGRIWGDMLERHMDKTARDNPWAFGAGDIAGGFLLPFGLLAKGGKALAAKQGAGKVAKGARAAGKVLDAPRKAAETVGPWWTAAGTGGALGGVYGLGVGEGSIGERLPGAAMGAGAGALAGPPAAWLTRKLTPGNAEELARFNLKKRNRGVSEVDPTQPLITQGTDNRQTLATLAKEFKDKDIDEGVLLSDPNILQRFGMGGQGPQTKATVIAEGIDQGAASGAQIRGRRQYGLERESTLFPFAIQEEVQSLFNQFLKKATKEEVENMNAQARTLWAKSTDDMKRVMAAIHEDVSKDFPEILSGDKVMSMVKEYSAKGPEIFNDLGAPDPLNVKLFLEKHVGKAEADLFARDMMDPNVGPELFSSFKKALDDASEVFYDAMSKSKTFQEFLDDVPLPTAEVGFGSPKRGAVAQRTLADVEQGYGTPSTLFETAKVAVQRFLTSRKTKEREVSNLLRESEKLAESTVRGKSNIPAKVSNPLLSEDFYPAIDIYAQGGAVIPSKVLTAGSGDDDDSLQTQQGKETKKSNGWSR